MTVGPKLACKLVWYWVGAIDGAHVLNGLVCRDQLPADDVTVIGSTV